MLSTDNDYYGIPFNGLVVCNYGIPDDDQGGYYITFATAGDDVDDAFTLYYENHAAWTASLAEHHVAPKQQPLD